MKLINYFLLIYFSIGACFPNCDFSQLAQLDELMEHYMLHQTEARLEGEQISFTDFLFEHFIQGETEDHQHDDEHDELPLYSECNGIPLWHYQKSSLSYRTVSDPYVSVTFVTDQLLEHDYLNKVFHPPINVCL